MKICLYVQCSWVKETITVCMSSIVDGLNVCVRVKEAECG